MIVLLPVDKSLLVVSLITNVLVNGTTHEPTAILAIGIVSDHEVYGLRYHRLMPVVEPPPLTKINHVYSVTLTLGR
jgi:hypothetical protein